MSWNDWSRLTTVLFFLRMHPLTSLISLRASHYLTGNEHLETYFKWVVDKGHHTTGIQQAHSHR